MGGGRGVWKRLAVVLLATRRRTVLSNSGNRAVTGIVGALIVCNSTFRTRGLIPVASRCGRLMASFNLGIVSPICSLVRRVLSTSISSDRGFSISPQPLSGGIPTGPLRGLIFGGFVCAGRSFCRGRLRGLNLVSSGTFAYTYCVSRINGGPGGSSILD